MSNELDMLMNLDPLELTRDSPELEAIIQIYRQQRANAAAGIKPKKDTGPKVDMGSILDRIKTRSGVDEAPKPKVSTGGLRRI